VVRLAGLEGRKFVTEPYLPTGPRKGLFLLEGQMDISISKDITHQFKTVSAKDWTHLYELITNNNWSSGAFKDGHRSVKNFLYADSIALDVDNNDPLNEVKIDKAAELFREYNALIVPSRSHRKVKSETQPAVDRYRVILPLSRRITDPSEYYGTFLSLFQKFPFIDPACKDPSRLWYPSSGDPIVLKGKSVEPSVPITKPEAVIVSAGMKGLINSKTKDFLIFGAKEGTWNVRLHESALDLRSQGYTRDEAISMLAMATREELGNSGRLDSSDLSTIDSAYKGDVFHEKRGPAKLFNFQKVSEISKEKSTVNWLVDDLLTVGGISLIAGPPKSGKSTIIRQLGKSIAQGLPFLDREVKRGKVLYLALEEQKEIVSQQLKALGVQDQDEFYIHCGPVLAPDKNETLKTLIEQERPAMLVIDTLILYSNVQDVNNYTEMYNILSFFRNLARDTATHICMLHHTNKIAGTTPSSIMGSNAIHGSVDNAMMFSIYKGKRFISSSQRGGKPFNNVELMFDEASQSYEINYENVNGGF
jgi:hypothetical protein